MYPWDVSISTALLNLIKHLAPEVSKHLSFLLDPLVKCGGYAKTCINGINGALISKCESHADALSQQKKWAQNWKCV